MNTRDGKVPEMEFGRIENIGIAPSQGRPASLAEACRALVSPGLRCVVLDHHDNRLSLQDEVAMAAHASLDAAAEASLRGQLFIVDYATMLADWDSAFEVMRGRVVQPPFDVTPIFVPGYIGDTCPLFVITREAGGFVKLMTALLVKNSGQLFWRVPDSAVNEEIADQIMAAALATIEARNLKPAGPRRSHAQISTRRRLRSRPAQSR
jgi:hypothetical protein